MTDNQWCDKNKNGGVGSACGAGGVFALGPKFQISFLNVKMNVRKKKTIKGPQLQKAENGRLNI